MSKWLFWITVSVIVVAVLSATASASDRGWFGVFSDRHQVEGSGKLVTETRDVPSFTRLEVSMGIDVVVNVGKPQSVKLTFDDNLLEKIKTRVHGSTLEIYSRSSFSSDSDCKIEINVPSFEGFSLAGSGDIEIHDVASNEFELEISGSGNVFLSGKTGRLEVDLSGSGDIDAAKLIADNVSVDLAGSGNVTVYATKSIDASVAGSGDIKYYGTPEDVSTDVSGSGTIRRLKG